jgi:hypothetical protein
MIASRLNGIRGKLQKKTRDSKKRYTPKRISIPKIKNDIAAEINSGKPSVDGHFHRLVALGQCVPVSDITSMFDVTTAMVVHCVNYLN